MKPEFRRDLARLPFEEKIRKVAELIRLSRNVKRQQLRGSLNDARAMDILTSERNRERER